MLKVVSAIVLALGIVILVVLVALGGVVKTTIHDTVINRLKYKLPPGYKNDPNYEVCLCSRTIFYNNNHSLMHSPSYTLPLYNVFSMVHIIHTQPFISFLQAIKQQSTNQPINQPIIFHSHSSLLSLRNAGAAPVPPSTRSTTYGTSPTPTSSSMVPSPTSISLVCMGHDHIPSINSYSITPYPIPP